MANEQQKQCRKLIKKLERLDREYHRFVEKNRREFNETKSLLYQRQILCRHESHQTHMPDVCPDCFENFRENESYG